MAAKRKRGARKKKAERRPHRKGRSAPRSVCASCGAAPHDQESGDELVRLVHVPDIGWVPDERNRLDGPSVHVHCTKACVSGLGADALGPEIEPGALRESLAAWLDASVLEALSRVAAAGQVIAGHDVLKDALARDEIVDLLVSRDAAPRTRRSLERATSHGIAIHTLDVEKETLGARVGQRPVAAVGIKRTSASAPLRRRLAMRRALHGDEPSG